MNTALPAKIPFGGETMRCVCCGKEQKSDPRISSDWRAVDLDHTRFYACAEEFPPDGASQIEFQMAYERFILAAINELRSPR